MHAKRSVHTFTLLQTGLNGCTKKNVMYCSSPATLASLDARNSSLN